MSEPTREEIELRAEAVYIAIKLLADVQAYRWKVAIRGCTSLEAKIQAVMCEAEKG